MRQQTGKNQSWRKNWEKKWNKNWKTGWIKRAAAVGLAASMAVTTPLSVLAENTTSIEQNETVTAAFTADSTADAETNNQSEISNQEETNHQKEINNQGEIDDQDSTAAEKPSKEEVQLSLQLVAVEADTTTPSLKLEEADKLSGNLKVDNTSEDGTKTIEVTDGEGLIMLSNVKPEDYKNCTIKLVTTSGWNLTKPVTPTKANETSGTTGTDGTGEVAGTQYHFLGLGDAASPYEGRFMFDKKTSANNFSISTTKSLFNALSTKATLEDMIPFSIDKENSTSTEPLLAAALKAGISDSAGDQSTKTTLKCDIALRNINAEEISSEPTIGGLIGTMEANTSTDITFTNQFSKKLNVSGTSHVGLFCNTMESGASLTATYTKDSGAGKISVKTTSLNNDAGGFVGHMETNTSLTIAGTSVDQVSAESGNAGGIVGSATDGTISLKTETAADGTNDPTTFTFADVLTLSAGSEKAVGGLIGAYSVTSARNGTLINFNLSQYKFKSITVTGGKDVGGLFGALKNTSTTSATVTVSGKTTSAITTNVTNETEVTNLGGLIGTYDTVESTNPNSAAVMKNTLAIKGDSNKDDSFIAAATTGGSKANTTYGGVIGAVSGSSYVEIENVSASIADMKDSSNTSVGGLVGKINDGFLNVGSVKLATTGDNDLGKAAEKNKTGADNVEGHGGLVGHLVKGVLRLHGETNLSGQKITTAYNHVGQIVGFNENGLIYALGNGNNLDSNGSGWRLTRYLGADRGGSDIGNWGSVIRLGKNLSEKVNTSTSETSNSVFTFNETAHTVTINNGNETEISNENDFAAYALAFVFAKTDTGKTEALKVNKDVNRDDKQNVTLTGAVDLTGTGIIGIGKDNIEQGKSAQKFTGTLDGGGYTITLDIGTPYGVDIKDTDNAAGQLYAKRSDQRDTHYSLALIPFAGDVTISNLTIVGNVNCKIPKTVNQEKTNIKYPAFVASAIGLASGKTAFNNVTVNTIVSVTEEATETTVTKKLLAWQGGFLARCEGSTLSFTSCKWGYSASLDDERNTDNHRIGGLAAEVMGGCTVTVKDCTLSGSITSKSAVNANVGGLIAVSRGEDSNNNSTISTINISNLQVNGENVTTSAATTSGGLLGYQWKNTNVEFAAAGSTGNADAGTIVAQSGVTISGSTLNANTAQFGGLVYQASGYWNATAKDSIVFATAGGNASDAQQTGTNSNTFTGKSDQDTPSGLLVGTGLITETKETNTTTTALYLEVGTWGNASDAAYKINDDAVTLGISNSEYFDELVGITIFDNAGNNNAVVSLAVRDSSGKAVKIDKGDESTKTNTYTGQLDNKNYRNGKTRYYYNLDSYRKDKYTTDLKIINTAEDLVLWSAAQYAAENIRTCFRREITSTPDNLFITSISGNLNLEGYSYYPVTPLTIVHIGSENENDTKNKTTLTFAYDTMNTIEGTNKQFSDSDHQHYLMQHGLLYNTSHGILVNQTAFAGVVGKELIKKADGTDNTTQYSSGALIYGSVIGNPISNIVGITLKNVTLDGIRVTCVEKEDTYAPLLINRIAKAATLIVNNLSTSDKYMTGEGTNKTTAYAATSLIGSVGSNQASKLTLSFSNIALDGRVSEDTAKSTSVQNNGKTTVEYNTTHTIFTRATLMEYFMYSSDGSGTYNFNSTDDKVTYGVELTNTGTSGRNPDKQYQYYDDDIYITDEQNKTVDEAYVKTRYSSDKFLRYVYVVQDTNNSKYELDINQRSTGLLKGCGTYGDPYIIENALQLSSLATYISTPGSVSKFQAVFNSKVLESQQQTAESYHTQNATTDATGTDITYTWQNNAWKAETTDNVTESADDALNGIDTKTATKYLLNAYYKIENDIMISAETFSGLGTLTNPFSGVIIGGNTSDANQPVTVHITKTNANKDSFGGLIAYSRGSVVKDLTVDYSQADIQMNAEKCPGTEKNPFFGGVVGYCMGGDTIIDHVSVNYSANTVSFGGTYQELIAAGGYVGLVGGATNVTEKSDYEKTGGGVIFRNMTGTTNTFTTVCEEAAAKNKTVNMLKADGTPDGKTTTDDGNYFYRNPYVGRVLDGYACAENCKVDNTDKNYTIPNLQVRTTDLTVSENSGALDVTVTSAQGLWLLSAIVNSGAGAMDLTGSYTDVDNNVVDAYQYGKPRTASYDGIGEAGEAVAKLADEAYWGGNASTAGSDDAKDRVSYLVNNYTTGTIAARLAGKSSDAKTTTNIPVNLTFNADSNSIDMTNYGNGFRGIGCSYGENKEVWNTDCSIPKVYRRSFLIKSINDKKTSATTITLNMNQSSYDSERTNGSWCSQGAGLFVDFHFTDNCTVNNLIISGNVKLGLFNDNSLTYMSKVSGRAVGVGGFAVRTANSTGTVTFNNFSLDTMNVYGGTMTGGAIGYIDGYNKAQRNVTFNNWSIKNANVSKWVDNDGSTGGLVGWNIGYGSVVITGENKSETCSESVTNLSVATYSERVKYYDEKEKKNKDKPIQAAAGGLVGACDFSSVNISNVNAKDLTVTGELVRDIGGLIAGKRNGTDKDVSVENCVLHTVNVDNPTDSIGITGGIIGYHDGQLTIKSVTLDKYSTINGQQYTGGFVGQSNATVSIANCSEKNVSVKSNKKNWVGGFIGHLYLYKNATFTNCQQENVTVLGRYVGGLVGAADGNMQASNIEFQNVIVATKQGEPRYTGLLTGSTYINKKNISVKGYNILAQSCKVGLVDAKGASNLLTAEIKTMDNAGFWIGVSGPLDIINLTAVSAFGTVFPQKDIGKQSGSATIIYADAAADKTYKPIDTAAKPSSSANPWLDVNPKSDVPFADGTVMTGNAVGAGKTETDTASAILTELGKTSHDSAYYWNVDNSTKEDVAKLLVSTNDAYLTTYRAEESANTTVSEKVDFPVLVVNNSAEVDTLLWNFIAAMTNVENGETAKKQVKGITATTYKWNSISDTDDTNPTFVVQDKASLTVSSSKKISITPNAYDNQSSQFTLLDVTYEDPTDNKHVFHLYVPVLVKKVLYINFKTRFIAGTDYCASDYPMTDTSTNHYATAGFNEPVTAYMEYRYEKETDWQSMLDNGENLLWCYDKILDLASGSTSAVDTTLLPAGTRLTLVDRQTMQYYTYTTTGKEDFHKFKLTDMTAPGTDSAGKPSPFAPVFICDLLELKAEEASNPTDGATYYVQETDPSKATVRVGADYYRKATDEDVKGSNVTKYKITVPSENGKPIVKERTESYYLTIQIPDTKDLSIVNNRLYAATMSRKEGTLPAVIKSDETTDSSAYVVYNGVQQSLTISTSRIHNGSDTGDTAMENGDGIKISLTGKLWLTEAGKNQFKSLGPSEVYHEFDVSLKKYLKKAAGISDVIGTENITYTYTVAKSNNELITTKKGTLSGIAGNDTLTLQYGSADLKKALELAETENSAVTVTAVITLTYDGADKFPVRDTAVNGDNSDNSGTSVVGVSRIANTSTQLPITENKKNEEDKNRYYVTNPSKAKLTYSSVNVDPNVTSDTTQQLGVNPWDTVKNRSDMIYTRADYDYSNVDAAVLYNAKKIRYKMELFQKNETGSYDETKPLIIKDYLQNIVKENGSTEAPLAGSSGTDTVYQWEENFKSDDGRHQIARFQYAPLTGEAFEQKKYTYANYRVRLTAVLLDDKGNELDGTKATDYIIYTNARISQEIMQQQQ